jgi:hypothetical protein
MYDRPVTCGVPGCDQPAEYKIAAPWSAGRFSELKTYGLGCEAHYADLYRDALRRRKTHPPTSEEAQGDIAVFKFAKGKAGARLEQVAKPE